MTVLDWRRIPIHFPPRLHSDSSAKSVAALLRVTISCINFGLNTDLLEVVDVDVVGCLCWRFCALTRRTSMLLQCSVFHTTTYKQANRSHCGRKVCSGYGRNIMKWTHTIWCFITTKTSGGRESVDVGRQSTLLIGTTLLSKRYGGKCVIILFRVIIPYIKFTETSQMTSTNLWGKEIINGKVIIFLMWKVLFT